ncbi:MAG TPA: hypothetical protein VFD48_15635 [Pyrinomonadaceae bacterium]|nr:hypothetical protein [Pyrinomonadaceae bacterium]
MKRLVFSVVGGVVIPFLYMVIVGPLTTYIQDDHVKQLMGYPVRWPVIILQGLLPLGSFPFRDEDELFLLLLIVLCDVLFYSILTYILLWRFWKQKPQMLSLPPEPPQFI